MAPSIFIFVINPDPDPNLLRILVPAGYSIEH